MMRIVATQERGWVNQFPQDVVAGKWRWSLLGNAPQTIEEDTGSGATFDVDETIEANRGEYSVSVQRIDVNGAALGDSQSSAPFVIEMVPPVFIDVEVAGPVQVTISKV